MARAQRSVAHARFAVVPLRFHAADRPRRAPREGRDQSSRLIGCGRDEEDATRTESRSFGQKATVVRCMQPRCRLMAWLRATSGPIRGLSGVNDEKVIHRRPFNFDRARARRAGDRARALCSVTFARLSTDAYLSRRNFYTVTRNNGTARGVRETGDDRSEEMCAPT